MIHGSHCCLPVQRGTVNSSKEWLKGAARLIGRGFLLGIGFGVAVGLIELAVTRWTAENAKEAAGFTDTERSIAKDIVLADVEEQKHDGTVAIVGKATNRGKKPVHGVHIQANLFNHDKFVDQYSTYLTGALDVGSSRFFKISCGCKDTPPAEHDSYKLEILTSY
jgi:hypothetical protein